MSEPQSRFPGLPGFNPNSIQPWIITVVVSVTMLALLSVSMRLLSRSAKRQPLWWDDYTIIFSMMWNLAVVGFIFVMHDNGMGLHADQVPVKEIIEMAKWLVVAEIFYAWNLVWTKISLVLLYSRIFPTTLIRRTCMGIGIFVVIWGFTIMFLFIFICVPVNKLWRPEIPGHCIDQVATWIANAVSTILTDLAILLIPIPQIWKLQLRRGDKVGLTIAFGLGFFVVFASSYRTSVLFTYNSRDPTYTLAPTVGWTAIEMSAGIVSACLPTMGPALQHLAQKCGIKRNIFGGSSHAGDNKTTDRAQSPYDTAATLTIGGGRLSYPLRQSQARKLPLNTASSREELFQGQTDAGAGASTSSNSRRISSISGVVGDGRLYGRDDDRRASASLQSPPDADLRPDVRGVMYKVSSYPTNFGSGEMRRKDSKQVDETPPNGIMVHKDIIQSSSLASDRISL